MELVQWIVPQDDGALAVGWAPVWADRVTSLGRVKGPVRRRGAPLVSRWLTSSLVIGTVEAADDTPPRSIATGGLGVIFAFAADADPPRPLLGPSADDVRFAGVLAELVRVVADLSESVGLPATSLAPSPERRGVELVVGAIGMLSAAQLADALVLFRVAVESCAQARGLAVTDARVRVDDKTAPIDGRVVRFFGSGVAMTAALTVLLSTAPDVDTAKKIARVLVEERLVACVNIVPAVTSVYRWQGKLEESSEVLCVLKTTPERVHAVAARLREIHPYEIPELIALPVDTALPAYADWIAAETARVVL